MLNDDDGMNPMNLPLYKKGKEILELVDQICDLIPEEDSHLSHVKSIMYEDAMNLMVKVAGAEGGDLYSIRMEAATIIRKSAMELMVQNHALEMFGFEHVEYFQMVRDLIDEYRLLFIEWISTFDPWNYVIDRWGLFNPPGVGPFDKDPDEDIPFNGFDDI